jgi:hypothetical protein
VALLLHGVVERARAGRGRNTRCAVLCKALGVQLKAALGLLARNTQLSSNLFISGH